MSRGGYAGLEEILRKKKLEELKSMDPDSTVSSSSIVIPRHIKWKRGRMTKEGGYINEEVSQVAAKIDELDEQSSEGSFVCLGKNDILITALGTPEHSGRVRGFSGNVGLKKVFGKSDREPRFSAKDIQVMIKDGIKKELATFMSQMGVVPSSQSFTEDINPMNKHELHQSAKVSCPSNPNPFANVPEGGLMCHLFVDNDGARWEVAIGRVFCLSDKLHGLSLPINHMKVTVDIPLVKDSPVPVPTDKVQKVFQAIGSFLTWPMYLIELVPEEFGDSEVKKAESVKTKESFNQPKESEDLAHVNPRMLPTICIGLHAFAMQMKSCSPILIPIDAKVMNNAYDLYVSKADIYQLLAMSMLNTSCIELYMLHMFNICQERNISNMFGFICPSITRWGASSLEKTKYMKKCFMAEQKECFIAPYIDDNKKHWMLLVIYPYEDKVFWLDPLGYSPGLEVKEAVETTLKIYHVSGHIRKSGARLSWTKVKCPRQKGGTECGYFILTYMRNIIDGVHHKDPQKCFQDEAPYPQEELDITRSQWADFFLKCQAHLLE